ncbi:MAG TPA: DUF885 domain-containing protein [Gemmatimonadales bacterium]|nr:DUF885 domain-containing protein [Gemmatimonadales bacterium]
MTPPASLADLSASYFDVRWHLDPVDATASGVRDHDHRLGRYTLEDVRQHLAALRALAGAVEGAEVASVEDEIDRTALLNEIRVSIHRFSVERVHVTNPAFWLNHALEGLYFLLERRDRPLEHRARAAAGRLAEFPAFFEGARATLRECPRVFVETALRVAAGAQQVLEEVGRHLRPADDPRFDQTLVSAGEALADFRRYLDGDLFPNANGAFAIGEEAFNFRLHYEHALGSTAPELWRYGMALTEELDAELRDFARRLNGSSAWPALVDRLRNEHPPADQLVASYAAEMDRARVFVAERGLAAIPTGPRDVIETPPFLKPLMPYAAYQPPGAMSADRTGWFYVTPPDPSLPPEAAEQMLRDHCVHEIASTALHEGFPGHHLHFLTAQALERPLRRILGTALTIEGWALYCEEMMEEEGFYRTPEECFFRRVHLLWRALRIVLDVGLHTRGMSFDDAVNLLVDRVHFDRTNAEAEVRRYCAYPAYQLCYAVGRRELRLLREAYRAAMGSEYTLRKFHDAVMQYGTLPVSLMRWGMGLEA